MDVWNDGGFVHRSITYMREETKALLDDLSSQGDQRNAPRITMSTILAESSTTFDLALFAYTTELPHGVSTLRQLFMETSTWWNPRHDRTWDSRWL
jgi:hypothetical protein